MAAMVLEVGRELQGTEGGGRGEGEDGKGSVEKGERGTGVGG
jgi:hypothetical protein